MGLNKDLQNFLDMIFRMGVFFVQAVKIFLWQPFFVWKIFIFFDNFTNFFCWPRKPGALKCLEIEAAIRYYQKVRNAGMVLSLMSLVKEEDSYYLQGSCAMLLRRFDVAQSAYLKSSEPQAQL